MKRVTGNTYPVKEILKSVCGARWNAIEKAWFVRQDMILVAMAIVDRGMTANQFYNREESDDSSVTAKTTRVAGASLPHPASRIPLCRRD